MDAPADRRGLVDPHRRVALALAGRQRVDRLQRPLRAPTRSPEIQPHRVRSAPRSGDPGCRAAPSIDSNSQFWVEQRQLELVRRAPSTPPAPRPPSGYAEASVTPGWSQTPLRSTNDGWDVRRPRRPGEDEGLVPELVERRAHLAGDHALPAVEPVGAVSRLASARSIESGASRPGGVHPAAIGRGPEEDHRRVRRCRRGSTAMIADVVKELELLPRTCLGSHFLQRMSARRDRSRR